MQYAYFSIEFQPQYAYRLYAYKKRVLWFSMINLGLYHGSLKGFLKTTDHLPQTTYQPTSRPPIKSTDHRPPTNRPPISNKFEDQKKFEFIFDITYS